MNAKHDALNLFGRLFIAVMFLPAGFSKATGFEGAVGYFTSLGIIAPVLVLILTIILEIAGGLALIVGYKTRMTAMLLAVFTLAASVTGHAFWAAAPETAFMEQLLFFKNIAIAGGLLILASVGAGKFSVDGLELPQKTKLN